jgi:hypothetical protein
MINLPNLAYRRPQNFLCQLHPAMPDIPCGAQIFDLAFHPTHSTVYTGLLTGEIKAFGYDEQGNHEINFALRPSKRSCRSLEISQTGEKLWAVGKGKAL